MHKRFVVLGLMLAATIAGVAWAHQSGTKVATHVETVDAGTGGATPLSGRVTSVDPSGRTVTIDMAHTSTDFSSINAGDQVQVQLATDAGAVNGDGVTSGAAQNNGLVSADGSQPPKSGSPQRLLGLWLLAMTGTTVVLRSRRSRTI